MKGFDEILLTSRVKCTKLERDDWIIAKYNNPERL